MEKQSYVPRIDTKAGACLSALNWLEAGAQVLSCSLSSLLMKPGACVLGQLENISSYFGKKHRIVLDGSELSADKKGLYTLQSVYDGSRISLEAEPLLELIIQLSPDYVLLPKGLITLLLMLEHQWPKKIFPLLSLEEAHLAPPNTPHGIYFTAKEKGLLNDYKTIPKVGVGNMNKLEIEQLLREGALFIITDQPAQEGYQGLVYTAEGTIDLGADIMSQQFIVIDELCLCPVCQQQLTRAYLHHLLEQTPLLCHRFLIQHNAGYLFQNRS